MSLVAAGVAAYPSAPIRALAAGTPTVTALAPESGAAVGGTTVTISGTNFVAGSTSVTFGSLSGTAVSVSSSTQLKVVTPAEANGQVNVTVTTTSGGSSAANPPHSTFLVVPSGQYVPVTATRICDTRTGNSTPCSGHRLGSDITYQVTVGGAGGVPTDAVAAIINVTAVAPTALGLLEVYPYGLGQPTGSNVSYSAGINMPNLVEVPLGTGGAISVYNGSTGSTDMLIDVQGYIPAISSGSSGRMNLLSTAARICDTRSGNSTQCNALGPLGAAKSITIHVTGQGGVPTSGVQAVVIDLTALPTGNGGGQLTAYPNGNTLPGVSDVNYVSSNVANRVIVPVGTGGEIIIYNWGAGTANILVDVDAWTTTGTGSPSGTDLDAMAINRACDTRVTSTDCGGFKLPGGSSPPGNPIDTFLIAGVAGLPSAGTLTAVAINVTLIGPSGAGYAEVWPDGATAPSTSDVQFASGTTTANFDAVVGIGRDGKVDIWSSKAADVIIDVEGWYGGTVPSAPQNLAAVGGLGLARVTWTPPLASTGSPVSSYTVTPITGGHGGTPTVVAGNVTSTPVTGLTVGSQYTFTVVANSALGAGPSATSNAVTIASTSPTAPTFGSGNSYLANASYTNQPQALAHGDFRGLGRTDIALGVASEVDVFLETATNTYSAAVSYPVAGPVAGIAIGDINGDGIPDIATANSSNDTVSILSGSTTRNGTFAAAVTVSLGTNQPESIALAPMYGTGRLDLVVGVVKSDGNGAVATVKNNGDGTFGTPILSQETGQYGSGMTAIIANSIDGGPVQVFVATGQANIQSGIGENVVVMTSDGHGNLTNLTDYADGCKGIYCTPGNAEAIAVASLQGNGIADLIMTTTNSPSDAAWIFPGTGGGAFSSTPIEIPWTHPISPSSITVADVNGDGIPDLIMASGSGVTIGLGYGDGQNFAGPFNLAPASGDEAYQADSADINGDGKPDVIAASHGALEHVTTYLNGTPGFNLPSSPQALAQLFGGMGLCGSCYLKHVEQHASVGAPVTTSTGNFWHTFTDFDIPARGYNLGFSHTYNSLNAAQNGPLGYGWSFDAGMSLSYDAASQDATIVMENGSELPFQWDGAGYVAPSEDIGTLTHNGNGSWTLVRYNQDTVTFNSAGQMTTETNLNGYTITYGYSNGELSSITDQAGRSLTISWTGSHITQVADSVGRTVQFQYNDGQGNLTDVYDVKGGHTHFTYTTANDHMLLTMTDPNGNVVTNHYNAAGQVDYQYNGDTAHKTSFAYTTGTTSGETDVVITDPKGNQIQDVYVFGLLMSETKGYASSTPSTWTYSYSLTTQEPVHETDANGNVISMVYDANGNLIREVQPPAKSGQGARVETKTYDAHNNVLTDTDPTGITTTYTYDSYENLTSMSRPDVQTGKVATTAYCYYGSSGCGAPAGPSGDLYQLTDPSGKTTTYTYDAYGDVKTVTDGAGDTTTVNDDGVGRLVTKVSATNQTWTYQTDAFGSITSVTDPNHHETQYLFDADENLQHLIDANNRETTYQYNAQNEQTDIIPPDLSDQHTDYNLDGTIADQKDGLNNTISYGYDSQARMTSMTFNDGTARTTSYQYDPNGNQTKVIDPQSPSQTATYGYDADNELASIAYSDGATPNVTNILYTADGLRTSWTDGTGNWSLAYDTLNELTSSQDGFSNTTSYGYDLASRLTSLTYPGVSTPETLTYDAAGRLQTIGDWLSNTTTFGYTKDSILQTTTHSGSANLVDTNSYDVADNLTSISDAQGGTAYATFGETRDAANQVTQELPGGSALSGQAALNAGYDTREQVCYAGPNGGGTCAAPPTGATSYVYDAADEMTQAGTSTLTYNSANELCWTLPTASSNTCGSPPTGATTYGFDTRGNRVSDVPSSGSAVCDAYDQADRLTTITSGTGSSCSSSTSVGSYTYNANGLRMSKTVGSTTTQFAWNLSGSLPTLLQERVSGGSVTDYISGPNGTPLEQISGSSVLFYHADQLGSTRVLTDAAGTVEATYNYDAYGNLTSSTGTVVNPFLYAGQYKDAESGLYYLQARYYDPTTSQFLSRDPKVETTRSPYAYVSGNPVNASDPSGLHVACGGVDNAGGANASYSGIDSCANDLPWTGPIPSDNMDGDWCITIGNPNCQPLAPTVGICAGAGIFGGIGYDGSACFVVSGGFRHAAITLTGGAGLGLGGGGSFGPMVSNATCPQDLSGPFVSGGGGFGMLGGDTEFGLGQHGQLVGQGMLGFGPSAYGYASANRTTVIPLW
ncbi:MAG TPA: FG-GAP-like repeat-containing protein [Candidatus Saccharimonadales bacterium]|nr:FG-GAP-like repeat-containing protein [Candidatus Saccharimonadales bacterium]